MSADLLTVLRQPPVLRDYQRRGADEILACLARGRNPLYCLPTAGGKGPIIGAVASVVAQQDWEVWVFAHRDTLIGQLSEHLLDVGVDHGVIAPWAPLTEQRIQVCSIDTVRSRIAALADRLVRVKLIIADECHHFPMGGYQLIKAMCPNAQRAGTTATPFRMDGKPLGEDFDEEVRGPSPKQLEADGWIAPVTLIAPPTKVNLSKVKKRLGDFVVAQLSAAVNTDEVTQAAIYAYAQHAGGLPTLAFCVDVKHAVDAATAFKAAGWSVEVMESTMKRCLDPQPRETNRQARRRCIRGLATGRYQILFTIGMAGEGVDVPIVACGLDLRPTKSTQLWLQHCGRTKRLYAGKTEALWLDMMGNWGTHGMPNADREWSLKGGMKGLEKLVAAVRRCGNCHYVCERGPERCPRCNRKYPAPRPKLIQPASDARIAQLPGLGNLTSEQVRAASLKALLPLAKTKDDLIRIQIIKGYARGWVDYVMVERGIRDVQFGGGTKPSYRKFGRRW